MSSVQSRSVTVAVVSIHCLLMLLGFPDLIYSLVLSHEFIQMLPCVVATSVKMVKIIVAIFTQRDAVTEDSPKVFVVCIRLDVVSI